MTTSPIDELFGCELDLLKRGLSQLDLILACKEQKIRELEHELSGVNLENASLKSQVSRLKDTITQLQIKLDEASIVTINNLETRQIIDDFFKSL